MLAVLVMLLVPMGVMAQDSTLTPDPSPSGRGEEIEAPVVVDVGDGDVEISPDVEETPTDEETDETGFMAWLVQLFMLTLGSVVLIVAALFAFIIVVLIRNVMPKLAEMWPAGSPIFEAITDTADTISDDVYEKLKAAAAATAFTWDDDLVASFQQYLKTSPRG